MSVVTLVAVFSWLVASEASCFDCLINRSIFFQDDLPVVKSELRPTEDLIDEILQ